VLRASPESPRMFDSDVVDFFSRIPAWVVPLLFVPTVAGFAAWARVVIGVSWPLLALHVAAGWVVWTLMEYWLHRTLFHWVPDAPWGERFHFYLHGVHHQWFTDKYRLVMPPAVSVTLAVVVFSAMWGTGWLLSAWITPSWVHGTFAGIVLGYMVYDLTHYYIHHFKPLTRVGLALRSHHNKHHHNPKYAEKKFGVSTTIWDHVFGTYE
jgi:sterol desaturase/sphingolipid hydroxylase (fatty acid hydroxylase superfamily)